MSKSLTIAAAIVCGVAGTSQATTISSLDLSALSFEVDSLPSSTWAASATGTSNGIGYSVSVATGGFYVPLSNTTNSQTYNDLPGSYDDLHLGRDFTITFANPISMLLIAMGNDNNTLDGPDFGIQPDETVGINLIGSQLSITDIHGALALFSFSTPVTSLSHVNIGRLDGYDMSFFAYPAPSPIPLPAGLPLLLTALAGGFAVSRKKRAS